MLKGIDPILNADLLHAQGLLRVRQGRMPEALPLFAQAAMAAPDNLRYAYVHAIALHDAGQVPAAITELERALARHPDSPELLVGLRDYSQSMGDAAAATRYGKRLDDVLAAAR